jgi:GMP synthase-like glutamine amidotransferase
MKIGLLQCGHMADSIAAVHGDYDALYGRLLAPHGIEIVTYPVVDMVFPRGVHDCEGWLLSGSKHGVYDDLPFIAPLEDFVRRAHAAGLPVVGICFGHQLIAQALGGKVEKFSGGWAVGPQNYSLDAAGEVTLNAWHQDQIVTPPPTARVVGTSDFCAYPALAYGDTIWSIQPHPEFEGALVSQLIEVRRGSPGLTDPLLADAAAALATKTDNDRIGAEIARFFLAHQKAPADG